MSRVEKVAGIYCRGFFPATSAIFCTVFRNFCVFRHFKSPRLLNFYLSRDIKSLRLFLLKSRKKILDFPEFFYPRHFLPLKYYLQKIGRPGEVMVPFDFSPEQGRKASWEIFDLPDVPYR